MVFFLEFTQLSFQLQENLRTPFKCHIFEKNVPQIYPISTFENPISSFIVASPASKRRLTITTRKKMTIEIFVRLIFTTKENTNENFLDEQMDHIYQGMLFSHN